MNWQRAIEETVTGLGYDLVDAERSAGGLLRVLIDQLPLSNDRACSSNAHSETVITIDDCEKVTRQLQHVLEVEGCFYERLEVSSPGLDRPLKKAADYSRFVGEQVQLTLKMPFQGRKKYSGELQAQGDGWRLVLTGDKPAPTRATRRATTTNKPVRAAGQTDAVADLVLDFSLEEVREARLVPVVDFKGRRFAAPEELTVGHEVRSNDGLDGGRIR